MNTLLVVALALFASAAYADPSGNGVVVSGPSGVVTNHGAIGPVGHGWGLGHGVALARPSLIAHGAIVGHPQVWGNGYGLGINSLGLGYGHGINGWGLGYGNAINGWGLGYGHGINGWGLGYGHGVSAITAGHGSISASAHGAVIRGPPTAPVVVAGSSGKIVANGLWGPTSNIGHNGYAKGYGWW
ncbi:hypothetical protein WA026_009541 [Henosepilachna vigintioctopunctata]|uniref:Uncharacterized protein n=1 Tax=Henosepilachna vigintioctopunctata TaxID=420089 RepID=A0AAW1U8U3_9CUCU